MSLIKLSTVSVAYLLGGDKTSAQYSGPFSTNTMTGPYGYNAGSSRLRIYKGSLPTLNDIETILPNALRTTDLLITFSLPSNSWTVSTTSKIATTSAPLPTAATGSGTASWFFLSSVDSILSVVQGLVGEITLPGNGGELVINDLNIVSGTTYSLGSISFEFPATFSYP